MTAPNPVLGLIEQYGSLRETVGGYTPDRGTLQAEKAQSALDEAKALFAHIAALLVAAPVAQASTLPPCQRCGRYRSEPRRPYCAGCEPLYQLIPGPHTDGPCGPLCFQLKPVDPENREALQLQLALTSALEEVAEVERLKAEAGAKLLALEIQRDEARTALAHSVELVRTLKINHAGAMAGALAERDDARAEVERLNVAVSQEIEARDENAEWADRLAQAIAEYLHTDIGEHSNMNLPWQAALIALTDAVSPAQPGPLVLRLPEVPEGTVSLVGKMTKNRYVMHGGRWQFGTSRWTYAELLGHEGELRVELAPPREQRTAAEIWAGLSPMDRLVGGPLLELAEALDREAGLS